VLRVGEMVVLLVLQRAEKGFQSAVEKVEW
jgi:hypothetical protein